MYSRDKMNQDFKLHIFSNVEIQILSDVNKVVKSSHSKHFALWSNSGNETTQLVVMR